MLRHLSATNFCYGILGCILWFLPWSAKAQSHHTDPKADSVAARIAEAAGGQAIWDEAPFLRFTFKMYHGRELEYAVQHLWDKKLGIYRIEMPGPANEPYVAVFYTDTFEASVYWNGSKLIQKDAELIMKRVRSRYFHDLFFVALPFMLFDPGATRSYLPDSSGESEDAIQFVLPHWEGLPTTSFVVYADRTSGRLTRSAYRLPSGEIRTWVWQDYEELFTIDGSLLMATRKRAEQNPYVIETVRIGLPRMVSTDAMLSAEPVLVPRPEASSTDAEAQQQR